VTCLLIDRTARRAAWRRPAIHDWPIGIASLTGAASRGMLSARERWAGKSGVNRCNQGFAETMTLGDLLRRAVGLPSKVRAARAEGDQRPRGVPTRKGKDVNSGPPDAGGAQLSVASREQAAAWLAALEAGRLNPPRDVRDPRAWDIYWSNHIEVGALDQGFADMMSSDAALPGLLTRRGSQTILCAGNGLSTEALSLALLGFQVTALDISAVPAEVLGRMLRSPEHPVHRIPGFVIGDDNAMTFACSAPIDSELCPPMHRSADHAPKGGGALSFVTGDLMDPGVCPGPFDVVIERRTVQLFPQDAQISALDRLVGRLPERGVFVSHEHQGGWRPGQARTHHAEGWLRSRGFVLRHEAEGDQCDSALRLACLMFSTG
jgi:hypothetical protein